MIFINVHDYSLYIVRNAGMDFGSSFDEIIKGSEMHHHRKHGNVHGKSYRLHQKTIALIHEFGKTARYKVDTQKSKAFLYTNNETSETEIRKKKSHLIYQQEK